MIRSRSKRSGQLVSEINITPFTDVILVLLIIFIVATPLISQNNIEVKLPVASSAATSPGDVKKATITITKEGTVFLDGTAISTMALSEKMKSMVSTSKDYQVTISVDKECAFQDVVTVIDSLKKSGVSNLNISTTAA